MSSMIHGEGVSVRQAAQQMHCSERYVWQLIEQGRIEHYKVGRRRLVVPKVDTIDVGETLPVPIPTPAAVPPELDQFRALVEALMQRQEQRHQQEMAGLRVEMRRLDQENGALKAKVAALQAALRGMDVALHRAVSSESQE